MLDETGTKPLILEVTDTAKVKNVPDLTEH